LIKRKEYAMGFLPECQKMQKRYTRSLILKDPDSLYYKKIENVVPFKNQKTSV